MKLSLCAIVGLCLIPAIMCQDCDCDEIKECIKQEKENLQRQREECNSRCSEYLGEYQTARETCRIHKPDEMEAHSANENDIDGDPDKVRVKRHGRGRGHHKSHHGKNPFFRTLPEEFKTFRKCKTCCFKEAKAGDSFDDCMGNSTNDRFKRETTNDVTINGIVDTDNDGNEIGSAKNHTSGDVKPDSASGEMDDSNPSDSESSDSSCSGRRCSRGRGKGRGRGRGRGNRAWKGQTHGRHHGPKPGIKCVRSLECVPGNDPTGIRKTLRGCWQRNGNETKPNEVDDGQKRHKASHIEKLKAYCSCLTNEGVPDLDCDTIGQRRRGNGHGRGRNRGKGRGQGNGRSHGRGNNNRGRGNRNRESGGDTSGENDN